MAYQFIEQIFEKNMMDDRANINIFMFINKISQSDVINATGYTKGTVSKNLSGYNPISPSFVKKFCEVYKIPEDMIHIKQINFYSNICKERRQQILDETGTDPGDLRDIDLLKEYKYIAPKKPQSENAEIKNDDKK